MKEKRLPSGFPSAQLYEETNHEGGEQSQTGNTTDLGNELGQVVQLLLQRSGIGISPESCKNKSASLDQEKCDFKEHTHHDAAVETLLTDGDNHVLAITFENLGTRNHKTIGVRIGGVECMNVDTLALGLFSEGDALAVADLFDSVGLPGRAGLVALDIVAGDEDTVTRDNLTGLEEGNVTDEKILDVDYAFDTAADNLDTSLLLLVVENAELFLLLPIVEGTNHHL